MKNTREEVAAKWLCQANAKNPSMFLNDLSIMVDKMLRELDAAAKKGKKR